MEAEKNISGISENLAESISEQKGNEDLKTRKEILRGKRIAISVSESEELEQLGLSEQHLKDISIEIARYLIVNGAILLYGGDLRRNGYTKLFSELSYQYKYLNDKENRFINYFPFPNSVTVTLKDKADFVKQQVEARILEPPKHIGAIDTGKKYDPFQNIEDRFILSECFTDMRIIMSKESDARIILGGRQKNYVGYLPGIIEEAYHSLLAKKPVYLLGGFGGATKTLVEIITGNSPEQFTNEFHFDTDFLNQFRSFAEGKSSIKLDYGHLLDFFKSTNIESISSQNGLSAEENQILFASTNIHELVFLIVKGLKNISTGNK